MKIDNETDYQTRGIKRVLTAVHNHLAKVEGRLHSWGWVRFRVCYTRYKASSGHAALSGARCTLRLGRPGRLENRGWEVREGVVDQATVGTLVRLAWHEFFHLYGYRHENMARYWPDRDEVEAIADAAGWERTTPLPLYAHAREEETQEVDPQEQEREKRVDELRHALRKRKEWTTRARRAKTALAKWRRKEMRARRQLDELGVDADEIAQDELGSYEPAMAGDLAGV